MDETRTFVCPHCRATLEAAAGTEGTSLRCPSCGTQLTVPQQNAASGAQPSGTVCPVCKAPWQKAAVLCVSCGFDARTGKQHQTKIKSARNQPLFASRKLLQSMPYITTENLVVFVVIVGIAWFGLHRASERRAQRIAEAAAQAQQAAQRSEQSQLLGKALDQAKLALAGTSNAIVIASLKQVADACPLATNRTDAMVLIDKYSRQETLAQAALYRELSVALDNAVRDGELSAIDRLLERGAPVSGFERLTPLLSAYASGQADAIAHLLDKGANPAPLLAAASRYPGGVDTLELLAQRGSGVTNCNILQAFTTEGKGRKGERVLCSFTLLEYLLDKGASPSATNAVGQTAMHLLTQVHRGLVQVDGSSMSGQRGILSAAKQLLEKGCDPDIGAPPLPGLDATARTWGSRTGKDRADKPGKRSVERWTAIDYAAVRGDLQLVDLLLQHAQTHGRKAQDVARRAVLLASRFNSPCQDFTPCEHSEDGTPPLTLEETMTEHLVKKGADANSRDERGIGCLHEAAGHGSERSCRALLDAGADPKAKTDLGLSPLHVAAETGADKIAKLLLDAGAEVDAQDVDGATPLHHALRKGNGPVRDLLLGKRANVELADKQGMSALHVAAEASDWESSLRLLSEKAEVNRRDGKGRTPVLVAAENMKSDVSMLVAGLIHAGADLTLRDAAGRDVSDVLTSHANKAIRDVGYSFLQGKAQDYVAFVKTEMAKAKAAEERTRMEQAQRDAAGGQR